MDTKREKSIGWNSLCSYHRYHRFVEMNSKRWCCQLKVFRMWWTLSLTHSLPFSYISISCIIGMFALLEICTLFFVPHALSPSLSHSHAHKFNNFSTATSINHRMDKLMHIPSNAKKKSWLNKFEVPCDGVRSNHFAFLHPLAYYHHYFLFSFEFWLAIKF